MENVNDYCKPEDFEFFLQQRHLLTQNAVDGIRLRAKSAEATVGLINHGSTCYLNAIMQCLVQNASFLKTLFTTKEGDENPIIKELKKLITFLVHSIRNAVGTKELLASFGWNQSQIHDQHDAQEFYSILLDALAQASAVLEGKLQENFRGSDSDVIQCTECNYQKANDSFFQHLSVEVPDHLEGKPSDTTHSLSTLLSDLLKSEVLDENNKWECSSCNRKVCANRHHTFKSLPETISIHLKRFRFDPTSKKRRKLNTSIEFQEQYNFMELLQPTTASFDEGGSNAVNGVYQLTGIVCHLGTAMGGHYKAFVRSLKDASTWWECNDENIHKCTEEEIQTLFLNNGSQQQLQQATIMENAYVLFYTRLSSSSSSVKEIDQYSMISNLIPVTKEMEEDNASYRTLINLSNIQRTIVHMDISIYRVNEILPFTNTGVYPFDFPKQTTVQQATHQIYEFVTSKGIVDGTIFTESNVRIRKFSNTRNSKGETFDSRESMTLGEIGLLEKESICFEIREHQDPIFVEYNPNEMLISLYRWDQSITPLTEIEAVIQSELELAKQGGVHTVTAQSSKWIEVTVPGREKATVAQLTTTIQEKFALSTEQTFLIIPFIQNSNIPLLVVDDQNAELRKKYQIFPGAKLFIEITNDTAAVTAASESKILTLLKSLRSKLRIAVNNPKAVTGSNGEEPFADYTNEIETTSDITLLQFKELVRSKLNLTENVDEFYCKTNKDGVQYKEESKTLEELGITDQSMIHIQLGKGCKPGEHFLRFELDIGRIIQDPLQNRYILLTEIPMNEKATILSMKKQLFHQWEQLLQSFHQKIAQLPNAKEIQEALPSLLIEPKTLHHLRLRDFKNGKISGPLRDDRMICRCLLGLSDGRRIILQILPNEEIIGSDDLLITIRTAFYYYQPRVLSDPQEISIPRSFKVKDLYEKLVTYFPQMTTNLPNEVYDTANNITNSTIQREENNYIEFAKGYTTGPPVTLKSSLKLKWDFTKETVYSSAFSSADGIAGEANSNSNSNNIGETDIDRPPLNLRDGSVLVLRNHYDYLKAQEIAQQKQKERLEAEENIIGVGGGVAAVRAKSLNSSQKRPGSSARYNRPGSSAKALRGSSTEPVLKIVTQDKSSRPPFPGEGKSAGIAGGGSPNENIMNNTLPEPSPQKQMI